MNLLFEISSLSFRWEDIEKPKEQSIKFKIYFDPYSPETLLNNLASMQRLIDVYYWYEGFQLLEKVNARVFAKTKWENIYEK